ncbi:SDR family oxidoreductase [Blastopirellula sp. J2-11]|uniref:SDR family oxidoreductase n=1 Tax=Blastopirellula sp. J2-11 TaxID=2943192 RepID=UPI0021C584DB|nr:SDR family oxidoreductase [Blastopirellula sp. J2-11]UUO07835.1 SDR family oxidoreductase [Blastopirellula sp. J2-11]
MSNLFSLQNRTVLLTGATGYLGSAMAVGLAEAGANVVVSSRRIDQAATIAARLPIVGDAKHYAVEIDHQEVDSLESGFQNALVQAGQIDVLVANGHEATAADWTTATPEQFTRQLQNATGYFLLARLLHDHVAARSGEGSVIFLGSMYGVVGSYPDAYAGIAAASPVAYHALKGGVIQMTRHLAIYWAKEGVRVNCLSPGPFPSEKAPTAMVKNLCTHSPMGRMGRPEELIGPLVFLASDAASYVTGQNLLVDGGWTAW